MEAEKVIFSYIRTRGLRNTEQALKTELLNNKVEVPASLTLDKCESVFSSIVLPLTDPFLYDTYHTCFSLYKSWADSSLSLYKNDLLKFSSPIFIYMYLELLSNNRISHAQDFFLSFSSCLSKYDYSVLSSIKTPNDLDSDFLKKHYFQGLDDNSTKYLVAVRKSSLLLLMSFIEEKQLTGLIKIINEHIEVCICLEGSKDYPVLISDPEVYKNKSFLSLNVQIEEDKRREVKVPLPALNLKYLSTKGFENDEKIDLIKGLPYIICHNVKIGGVSSSSCSCIDISEDGSLIVAGFEDSVIRVWNLCNVTKNYYSLIGHSTGILSLTLSPCPEKTLLISSSDDGEIRLWMLQTKLCLCLFNFHSMPVWCVKFSPTGHYFSSGGQDTAVCLWSLEYTNPIKLLVGHVADIFALQFHPKGTFLASGGKDRVIRLWDTSTGECVRVFCGHKAPVMCIFISRLGKNLFSGDEDGVVQNWDINEKEMVWEICASSAITGIGISQENTLVACVLENSSVLLANATGEIIKTCKAKSLNMFTCSFTNKNLLCVAGSYK